MAVYRKNDLPQAQLIAPPASLLAHFDINAGAARYPQARNTFNATEFGLHVVTKLRHGECFFACISKAVYGTEANHVVVRTQVCDFMENFIVPNYDNLMPADKSALEYSFEIFHENRVTTNDFRAAALGKIATMRVWSEPAGQLELIVACYLFRLRIILLAHTKIFSDHRCQILETITDQQTTIIGGGRVLGTPNDDVGLILAAQSGVCAAVVPIVMIFTRYAYRTPNQTLASLPTGHYELLAPKNPGQVAAGRQVLGNTGQPHANSLCAIAALGRLQADAARGKQGRGRVGLGPTHYDDTKQAMAAANAPFINTGHAKVHPQPITDRDSEIRKLQHDIANIQRGKAQRLAEVNAKITQYKTQYDEQVVRLLSLQTQQGSADRIACQNLIMRSTEKLHEYTHMQATDIEFLANKEARLATLLHNTQPKLPSSSLHSVTPATPAIHAHPAELKRDTQIGGTVSGSHIPPVPDISTGHTAVSHTQPTKAAQANTEIALLRQRVSAFQLASDARVNTLGAEIARYTAELVSHEDALHQILQNSTETLKTQDDTTQLRQRMQKVKKLERDIEECEKKISLDKQALADLQAEFVKKTECKHIE